MINFVAFCQKKKILGLQVFRDFRGQDVDRQNKWTGEGIPKWKKKLAMFLAGRKPRRGEKITLAKTRLANKFHAQGQDQAWFVTTGLSLASFACEQPICWLRQGESRYCVAIEDCPPEVQAVAYGRTERVCFEDSEGNSRLLVNFSSVVS